MKLRYSMYSAPIGHPQDNMRMLGITYTESEPQPMADQWIFHGCKNVPDSLPEHLEEIEAKERI